MTASFFDRIFKSGKQTKKKSYLLLEILVALTLLSLISGLFTRGPSKLIEREILSLEKMELERVSDLLFMEWKRSLYKNRDILKDLSKGQVITLSPFSIPEISKKKWLPKIVVHVDKKKNYEGDLEAYFLNITLQIASGKTRHDFYYDLMVQQVQKKV